MGETLEQAGQLSSGSRGAKALPGGPARPKPEAGGRPEGAWLTGGLMGRLTYTLFFKLSSLIEPFLCARPQAKHLRCIRSEQVLVLHLFHRFGHCSDHVPKELPEATR